MRDWIGLATKNMREREAADILNLGFKRLAEEQATSEWHEDKHPESPGASEGKPQS